MLNSDNIRGFLNKNFVVIRAMSGMYNGENISEKYGVIGAPRIAVVNAEDIQIDLLPGFFRSAAELESKLNDSLSGKTLFLFEKAFQENPDDLVNIYNLAEKHFVASFDKTNSMKYIDLILARPDEASKFTVLFDVYPQGYTEINMLECTEYMEAEAEFRETRDGVAVKLADFAEKYPDSKLNRIAYSYATRGKWDDKERHMHLYKTAMKKYPADDSFKLFYISNSLENDENIDEAFSIAEKMLRERPPSNGWLNEMHAKLLVKKNEIATLKEKFGQEYYETLSRYYKYNVLDLINFWKKRDDSPLDLLEISANLFEQYPERRTRQVYAEFLHLNKKIEKLDVVYGDSFSKTIWDNSGQLNSYSWFWVGKESNLESACSASLRAIEIDPKKANYWGTLGKVYWKQEKYAEALKAVGKAKELNPKRKMYDEWLTDIKADMEKGKKGK